MSHWRTAPLLTPREQNILRYRAQGLTDKEIGPIVKISDHTVRHHVRNILQKTHAKSCAEAIFKFQSFQV